MSFRRALALVLALFTLQLNLLSADEACARHDKEPRQHATAGTNAQSMSAHHMHQPDVAVMSHATGVSNTQNHHEQPCEIPSQANCCRALVSCSMVFEADGGFALPQQAASLPISPHVTSVPRSEIVSPDPPPPKA
jgi:hypothetical protein